MDRSTGAAGVAGAVASVRAALRLLTRLPVGAVADDPGAAVDPDLADALAHGVTDIDWPGGETAARLGVRIEAAWTDLVARARPAVVVSHAGALRHALAPACSLPLGAVALLEPATAVRVQLCSDRAQPVSMLPSCP